MTHSVMIVKDTQCERVLKSDVSEECCDLSSVQFCVQNNAMSVNHTHRITNAMSVNL